MRTIIFLVIITFFSCQGDKAETKNQKPNVLFILVDDLGLMDLSCSGSQYYETPNIDRIANNGMVFTQGYAASRVCSPSRASIMTGQFTARHGITDWIGAKTGTQWREHNRHDKLLPADNGENLPHEQTSLAEAMKANGYKTFYAGKWHIGSEGSYPEDHGFEINKGGWEKGSPMGGYYAPWVNPKLESKHDGESLTLRLGKETADFISANKEDPFFAFLSFYAVHGPIQTTAAKWNKYRDKSESKGIAETGYKMERVLPIRQVQDNPIYAGLVETMDDAVGIVLDQLEELGLDKNTIVVFTSDNGGVASGDAFSTSNLPWRGGKGYQWEGGIREPYFINVPWLGNQGSKNQTPVIGTDFYPTILDFAGIPALPEQHIDGVSLKPLLEGKTIGKRPLFWHYPHYGNQGGNPSSIIRVDDWKLIHYWEDGSEELYYLANDPSETSDVAGTNPTLVTQLSQQLQDFLKETNALIPMPDKTFDEAMADKRHESIRNELWPRLERQRMNFLSKEYNPQNDWWSSSITED